MVAEPSPSASTQTSQAVPSNPRYRYRLRFRKSGTLRLVSHHDLMHVWERMTRRARLAVAHTQGFHPQPRLVFALSLALGLEGDREVLEIELSERLEPEELHARLTAQAPPGLDILTVRFLDSKSSSLVRRAFYRLALAGELDGDLPRRCAELLEQAHLWVERDRPKPRRLDVRPYLNSLSAQNSVLDMAVWVTPTGTARPEEYARLLGLEKVLQTAHFVRVDLEMADEVSGELADSTRGVPTNPMHEKDAVLRRPEPAPVPLAATRPTALLSGPLSFDS